MFAITHDSAINIMAPGRQSKNKDKSRKLSENGAIIKKFPLQKSNWENKAGTVDLQGYETSVLLLSFSNLCVTWSQARF